ncbi:hypothetical protein, partial [Streptomyces toxytricini]|uniref:hypothetical protein n=1 Tax=Streptomyces toxytricini TaxID=67369 RepID=UPI00342CE16C
RRPVSEALAEQRQPDRAVPASARLAALPALTGGTAPPATPTVVNPVVAAASHRPSSARTAEG